MRFVATISKHLLLHLPRARPITQDVGLVSSMLQQPTPRSLQTRENAFTAIYMPRAARKHLLSICHKFPWCIDALAITFFRLAECLSFLSSLAHISSPRGVRTVNAAGSPTDGQCDRMLVSVAFAAGS